MTNKQKYVLVAADAVVALAAPVFTVPVSTTALAACTGNPHDHDSGPTGNPHDNGEN